MQKVLYFTKQNASKALVCLTTKMSDKTMPCYGCVHVCVVSHFEHVHSSGTSGAFAEFTKVSTNFLKNELKEILQRLCNPNSTFFQRCKSPLYLRIIQQRLVK